MQRIRIHVVSRPIIKCSITGYEPQHEIVIHGPFEHNGGEAGQEKHTAW